MSQTETSANTFMSAVEEECYEAIKANLDASAGWLNGPGECFQGKKRFFATVACDPLQLFGTEYKITCVALIYSKKNQIFRLLQEYALREYGLFLLNIAKERGQINLRLNRHIDPKQWFGNEQDTSARLYPHDQNTIPNRIFEKLGITRPYLVNPYKTVNQPIQKTPSPPPASPMQPVKSKQMSPTPTLDKMTFSPLQVPQMLATPIMFTLACGPDGIPRLVPYKV